MWGWRFCQSQRKFFAFDSCTEIRNNRKGKKRIYEFDDSSDSGDELIIKKTGQSIVKLRRAPYSDENLESLYSQLPCSARNDMVELQTFDSWCSHYKYLLQNPNNNDKQWRTKIHFSKSCYAKD